MREIVFFLEERSAEALIDQIFPRLFKDATHRCVVFEGKQDLERQLEGKLRRYLTPHAKFMILRDQDSGDCKSIKARLLKICKKADKPEALVRIVCRELESWYLGDLAAVERGLGCKGLTSQQFKAKFKNPDKHNSAKQILQELTNNSYREVPGSRAIGSHMNFKNNTSTSFQAFLSGLERLIAS